MLLIYFFKEEKGYVFWPSLRCCQKWQWCLVIFLHSLYLQLSKYTNIPDYQYKFENSQNNPDVPRVRRVGRWEGYLSESVFSSIVLKTTD